MTNAIFRKLAIRNIRSNKQIYLPYLLSAVATVSMFYLMANLLNNDFIHQRSSTLPLLFNFGVVVIGIFSFIFILYTNSFLIKRRKKELGLYAILGMKKLHVVRVLFLETLITGSIGILLGLIVGTVLGKLSFLALNYVLHFPAKMNFTLSAGTVLLTVGVFAAIFLIALLYNISQVTFSNPIKLMKGKQAGEKEPKSSIFLFLLAIGLLGSGYWISLTISDPIAALTKFFLAVLLVIAGTYFLFISGSIFILKALKNNKKLYYRPNAFISISGMLYRMKQNATGLANITILATMVIIAVSTTATLFLGTEETLENRFPYENNVTIYNGNEMMENTLATIDKITEKKELSTQDLHHYRYQQMFGTIKDQSFVVSKSEAGKLPPMNMLIFSADDFSNVIEQDLSVKENEALFFSSKDVDVPSDLTLGEETFKTAALKNSQLSSKSKETIEDLSGEQLIDTLILVVDSFDTAQSIVEDYQTEQPDATAASLYGIIGWNTTGTEDEKESYRNEISEQLNKENDGQDSEAFQVYESREQNKEDWYGMNGGFLFLGIFLGALFTFGAILITYYKQVSEGYDDREKFQIMQKVGLDKKMIRKTTRFQIVWMFFLPLIVAVIHIAFAFPIIQKLLVLFGITNNHYLLLSTAVVVLLFSLVYWLIYHITSRVYYHIVE